MIFDEAVYYAFFLLPAAGAFHAVSLRLRPWVLAFFGAAFFVYFGYLHFGGAWGALCVLLFVWELLTSRLYRPGSRWCVFGVVQAVAILVAFKYLGLLGLPRLLVPLGLSFFTFEFIHFAVESRRGRFGDRPPPLGDYAAFIFFFPTLVAGPIKRYEDFAPKIASARLDPVLLSEGITRILVGLAKKHVLADTFSIWYERLGTDAVHAASPLELAGWVLAYGMKIYFDFSGYSDIAIGSAGLFGIRVSENFDWPYLSRNIAEFWRRWHISLGRWILDYVYKPLGGSHGTASRTSANLLVAFAVSGLWHGAAWNFLAWGLWHGILIVAHRAWASAGATMPRVPAVALTFVSVNLGWALFCMDFERLSVVARAFARGWLT
jgi:alginate O-acetyltransferase complex protein AlgI